MEPGTINSMREIRRGGGSLFRRSQLSIGTRLSACFVAIVVSMIAADVVVAWQLERMAAPTQRLGAANQASLAIVRVHLDEDAFQDRATELARTHDARRFANEVASLRHTFLQDVEHTEQALLQRPAIEQDPTISSALETLKVALPSQLDTMLALATAGDWNAFGLRLVRQSQDPIQLSSLLVERLNQQVLQERARAVENTERARRQLFIAIPIAGLLTLSVAAALGWFTTRTITVPLSALAAGAQALARGDFQHHIEVGRNDELAVVGKAFNYAARQLQQLYDGLRRSEAYLAEAQKLSRTGSFGWDVSSGEIYWSRETFRIFEYEPTSHVSLDQIAQRTHPEDRLAVQRLMERFSREKKEWDFEHRLLMPNGSVKYLRVVGHPSKDESGRFEFVGAVTDITERKRADEELRRSEESYRIVVETASDVVISMDESGLILLANPATKSVFGYDSAELIGKPVTTLMPEFMRKLHETGLRRYLASGQRHINWQGTELIGLRKNGEEFPVEISFGEQIRNGRRVFTGFLRDISEKKKAEEALRRSESYLAQAQKIAHVGSWAWEVGGRKALYLSEEWYRVFGFDPKDGMPTWEDRLKRVHPDDRAPWQAAIERAIAEKSDYDVEFRILPPHTAVRFIHSVGHPVLGSSGEVLQFVGIAMDITERKRAEEERQRLRQAETDLAYMSRVSTMGEFTASLAHEIKQPIGAAVTNAEACARLLDRDQPDIAEAREAALEMVKDARRAAHIIDRVRSMYRKGSSELEMVDVNEVIGEMALMLHNEANRYSVTIRTDLAKSLPRIMADRIQLQQVLMNLMLNGIEAMRDTTGELSIKSRFAEDGQLLISISDAGVGLPTANPDRIFDAFFTTKPQGTGLGLAITRSIVASHGGRLWATANPGRGASFHFTLPSRVALSA